MRLVISTVRKCTRRGAEFSRFFISSSALLGKDFDNEIDPKDCPWTGLMSQVTRGTNLSFVEPFFPVLDKFEFDGTPTLGQEFVSWIDIGSREFSVAYMTAMRKAAPSFAGVEKRFTNFFGIDLLEEREVSLFDIMNVIFEYTAGLNPPALIPYGQSEFSFRGICQGVSQGR